MNGRNVSAGAVYFAAVFAAGFVLGTIRTLWVAPQVGTRTAELLEAPVMIAVTIFAARWVVRRWKVPSDAAPRLAIGFFGLALLLLAEFTVVLWIRGIGFREYWASRDPVSGTAYLLSLCLFAMMPLLAGRRKECEKS